MQCGLFDKGMKYKNESFSVLSFYCAIQRFNMASKPAPSVSHRLHSSVCGVWCWWRCIELYAAPVGSDRCSCGRLAVPASPTFVLPWALRSPACQIHVTTLSCSNVTPLN